MTSSAIYEESARGRKDENSSYQWGVKSCGRLSEKIIQTIRSAVLINNAIPVEIGKDFTGSLEEVGALIQKANLLISVETALVHIASA